MLIKLLFCFLNFKLYTDTAEPGRSNRYKMMLYTSTAVASLETYAPLHPVTAS